MASASAAATDQPAKVPAICGHRGARGLWPENTLGGFIAAIEIGVDDIELDVGLTQDGVCVVHHDPTLNRDTTRDASGQWLKRARNGPAPLHTLRYAELQALDVGGLRPRSRYGLRFARQRTLPGARIPTLTQALELLATAGVHITIEIKSIPTAPELTPPPRQMAAAVIDCMREANALGHARMTSFDWRVLAASMEIEPALPVSCLTIESRREDTIGRKGRKSAAAAGWTAGLALADFGGSVPRMVREFGSRSWSPNVANVDAVSAAEARAQGLAIHTWTVNRPGDMARMVELGVDGIITDFPDRLRDCMHARDLPLPSPGGRDPQHCQNGEV